MPHLPQLMFKFDPLVIPSGVIILWTPHFRMMHSHSIMWLVFLFICEKMIYCLENDLESPLIFVLFLKDKQNKKENSKCDSLFGKDNMWKTKIGSGGQVIYWQGTVVSRSTPLSPIIRFLLNKVRQLWQLIRKSMDTNEIIK